MHTGLLNASYEEKVLTVLKVPSLGTNKPWNEQAFERASLGTSKCARRAERIHTDSILR
jgi:hypothetical protein